MPYSNTLLRQSRAYLSVRSNAIVIILDFKEDTESMIEDGGVIHAVPTAALEYTCFCLPTRFQCGGFDLFNDGRAESILTAASNGDLSLTERAREQPVWLPLPAIGFHMGLLLCLSGEASELELFGQGNLRFTVNTGTISIHSYINGRSGLEARDDMVMAFLDYSQRLRKYLSESVPALQDHPSWPIWFPSSFPELA